MATKIIESEGDVVLSRVDSSLATRLDNAMLALEQKQNEFADYLNELKKRQEDVDELKKRLLSMMDENGVRKLETERLAITAVHPKPTRRIDLKELEARDPRLYKKAFDIAGTETETAGYVKITVKSNLIQ